MAFFKKLGLDKLPGVEMTRFIAQLAQVMASK